MAIVKELHDSTSVESALVKLPEIDAALIDAQLQIDSNLYWMDIFDDAILNGERIGVRCVPEEFELPLKP